MSMLTPVQSLKAVVMLAEEREAMGTMLTRFRSLSDTDMKTLDRILSDRYYLVELLNKFFEGRNNPFREPFEHQYQQSLRGALEHVFAFATSSRKHDEQP